MRYPTSRYGIGFIFFDRIMLFIGIAPTQCMVGVQWSTGLFEIAVGPLVLGIMTPTE